MKKLHYNATGTERKELVGVISKVIGIKPVYKFMPTCALHHRTQQEGHPRDLQGRHRDQSITP